MAPQDDDGNDPPAVVIDDQDIKTASDSFFSFAVPGKVTWWSLGVVGLLASLTCASIIIIAVKSAKRKPPIAFDAIEAAQCPYVSPLLPIIAYTMWTPACKYASFGEPIPCATQVDCAWASGVCASGDVVVQLHCAVPTLGGTGFDRFGQPQKVCSIVDGTASGNTAALGGFCTTAGTQCAVCAADGNCREGLTGCVPVTECSGANASSEWLCV